MRALSLRGSHESSILKVCGDRTDRFQKSYSIFLGKKNRLVVSMHTRQNLDYSTSPEVQTFTCSFGVPSLSGTKFALGILVPLGPSFFALGVIS